MESYYWVLAVAYFASTDTGQDYLGTPMEVRFASESGTGTEECVYISITVDGILENDEFFSVVLATHDDDIVLDRRSARVKIRDIEGE